jgi:hypothetical protein
MRLHHLIAAMLCAFCLMCLAQAGSTEALRAWRAALASGQPATVAAQVQVPFIYEGRTLDRAGIAREVAPWLLQPRLRACLQAALPKPEDGRLVLWCKPYAFYLDAIPGAGWRLTEFATDTP